MILPRFLVSVEVKLHDLGAAQGRRWSNAQDPTFVYESKQTGIATRKGLFAEAMLENSPTRLPGRVSSGDQRTIGQDCLRSRTDRYGSR